MRHRKKGKKLGRTSPHRERTLQALSNALIENKKITTTVAKAKELRPFVEPLITRAKEDTEHNRRQVFRHLQNKEMVSELFDEVADRVGNRPGGYTRVIKLGQRSGDGAELALVELVDYNDVKPADSSSSSSGGTRRGSGKGRRSDTSAATDAGSAEEASPDTEVTDEDDVADSDQAPAEADVDEEPEAEAEPAPESSEEDESPSQKDE
jgi:large subunit ribosomal protein L17